MTKQELLDAINSVTDPDQLHQVEGAVRNKLYSLDGRPSQKASVGGLISDPNDKWLVQTARGQYAKDGEIEIDDEATVSRGAEEGAYVQAWVFVYFPEKDEDEDEDDEWEDEYEHTFGECLASGKHLTSKDVNGICEYCGEDDEGVEPQ